MESSATKASAPGATLVRLLCLLVLVLMLASAAYGTAIAVQYFSRISV